MHFWLRLWVWVIPDARDFTDSGDFIGSADLGTLIFRGQEWPKTDNGRDRRKRDRSDIGNLGSFRV
jgi:hypothetical protein